MAKKSTKITFKHDGHVTTNTFRFAELDAKGKELEMREAIVGKIYMKKTAFGKNVETPPKKITVEVSW